MRECYLLGIDGGGTKTEAVLLGAENNEIARATRGPSNYHTAGQAAAEASLRKVIRQVLSAAGLEADDVAALGLGMAGVARPGDREIVQAMLARIAHFPRLVITHDAECALVGGLGQRYGVVVVAGTGAMAYGVNARGESRRADGWGFLMGDKGSAYWIGRRALRAVTSAADGRGPATDLEGALLAHLGRSSVSELVPRVYGRDFGVPQVAALAPLVSRAAQGGDAVARSILQEAGRQLGSTAAAVVRGLQMTKQAFEVALVGGVLRTRGPTRDAVIRALREVAPRAQPIAPRHDAAFGAALLAQRAGGET